MSLATAFVCGISAHLTYGQRFQALTTEADIGSVGIAGDSTYTSTSGVYTVRGSGADIWGSADAAHFVYQTVAGDCQLTARVVSTPMTDGWAKAGVMIREDLSPGSPNAFMMLTRDNGVMLQTRATANDATG